MTLLGYERGEAAARGRSSSAAELDRLIALARERGLNDDPLIRQRLAWCHTKVEIMRWIGLRVAHPLPRRAAPWARRVDLQALLERVPQARHRARRRHPRRRCVGADGAAPARFVRPTTRARPTRRTRGRRRSSTRVPARSTRARARCSATSSVRWCSASPKSRAPIPARGPTCRPSAADTRRVGGGHLGGCSSARVVADCGSPGGAPGPAGLAATAAVPPDPRPALPPRSVADAYGDARHAAEPGDVISYLQWCREWQDVGP